MKMIAFLPLRKGSKGIPGKNKKDFAGKPLFHWQVEALRDSESVDRIFIYTNDEEILNDKTWSLDERVYISYRNESDATDTASSEKALLNFLEEFTEEELPPKETGIVFSQATNPFVTSEDYAKAINFFKESKRSIVSVTALQRFYWKHYLYSEPSFPIMYPENYQVRLRPRRTDFNFKNSLLIENGAFYISSLHLILRDKIRVSEPCYGYVFENQYSYLEIDEPLDFEIAELVFKRERLGINE